MRIGKKTSKKVRGKSSDRVPKTQRRYPWGVLPRLAVAIEHCRREDAHQYLDQLLTVFREYGGSPQFFKLRCASILSYCMRAALRGGGPGEALMNDGFRMLNRFEKDLTWVQVERLMHRTLERMLNQVQPALRTNIEAVVRRIQKAMTASTESPRTLKQYADAADVSVAHLSRCFTAIIGRPFREEQRRLRMEAACRLLEETDYKIKVVAQRSGLSDPSQFIADFRKEIGMTPATYRKEHLARVGD